MFLIFLDYDISNCVVHVMDVASKLCNMELNDDMITAETLALRDCQSDEDMLIAMCYIAECFTFGTEP